MTLLDVAETDDWRRLLSWVMEILPENFSVVCDVFWASGESCRSIFDAPHVLEMEDPGSLLETGRNDSWRMVEKEKVGRSWTTLPEQFPEIAGSLRVLRRGMT